MLTLVSLSRRINDSRAVEDMLLSKHNVDSSEKAPISVTKPSRDLPGSEAGSSTDILAAVQPNSIALKPPQSGDSYDTGTEFISHVKRFAEQEKHIVYQHGGSRPYVIRMVCRNWKKPE